MEFIVGDSDEVGMVLVEMLAPSPVVLLPFKAKLQLAAVVVFEAVPANEAEVPDITAVKNEGILVVDIEVAVESHVKLNATVLSP